MSSPHERWLYAAAAIAIVVAIVSSSMLPAAWAKNLPMGHPSLSLSLSAGKDLRFDYFILSEESLEELRDDMTNKLYAIIETIVLPEIQKQFDEKKDVYTNGYVEYISVNYDVDDARLEILIAKQPEEYGCDTEGCHVRIVDANVPGELRLSQIHRVGMFVAVYETPDRQLIDRLYTKALSEAKILLSETSDALKEKKDQFLTDNTPIERFFLRQYEDISRVTIFFTPFKPGDPAGEPVDIVDTSNTYYKRAYSGVSENESSDTGEEWKTAHVVGKFLYSDPPKPDQIFKVQYRVINGIIENFNATYGFGTDLSFGINTETNGTLEIKFPRNYPYTNDYEYLSTGTYRPTGSIDGFMVGEIDDPPYTIHSEAFGKYCIQICPIEDVSVTTTTDCFFTFSIPVTGRSKIGLTSTYLLWQMPHHGDDVPDSCIPQTIVGTAPTSEHLRRCSELDIPLENCNDKEILENRSVAENEKRIEEEQIQIQNSMYIIGIGAAIAGVFAFITLRKR